MSWDFLNNTKYAYICIHKYHLDHVKNAAA